MIDSNWLTTTATTLLMILLTGIGAYIVLLLLTRVTGLRSFSKMSGFDFAVTVATGSVLASTLVTKDPPLLAGAFGLVVLYAMQYTVSKARRLAPAFERLVDNEPLLIMAGDEVLTDHLHQARLTEDDLTSRLRVAGITRRNQVFAVVFETTGDVAVLKQGGNVDRWLLRGVRGFDRLNLPPQAG